jgi:hypothetical protein
LSSSAGTPFDCASLTADSSEGETPGPCTGPGAAFAYSQYLQGGKVRL